MNPVMLLAVGLGPILTVFLIRTMTWTTSTLMAMKGGTPTHDTMTISSTHDHMDETTTTMTCHRSDATEVQDP